MKDMIRLSMKQVDTEFLSKEFKGMCLQQLKNVFEGGIIL